MDAWGSFALGVCGGGGSDTLAAIVVIVIAALYGWAVLSVLARAEDGTEQAMLIILLIVSIAIGGFLFLYPGGIEGDGDFLTRFMISLIVVSTIAVAASAMARSECRARGARRRCRRCPHPRWPAPALSFQHALRHRLPLVTQRSRLWMGLPSTGELRSHHRPPRHGRVLRER
jgi:hypothetical protein